MLTGLMASGIGGGVAVWQADTASDPRPVLSVGDAIDGQIVFQVNPDGSFLTAPDVPCRHEDGSDQDLPCVWRADRRGNLQGESYIVMPGDGDGEIVYFDR
jgi:hypothetical protein